MPASIGITYKGGGGGGGGGVKYAFNLMQRLWPSDRLLSATEFNFSLKKKKNESIGIVLFHW